LFYDPKAMRWILTIPIFCSLAWSQGYVGLKGYIGKGGSIGGASSIANIVIDPSVTPCVTENNTTSSATVVCSLTSITAGDTLLCFPANYSTLGGHLVSVTDTANGIFNSANYHESGASLNVGGEGIFYYLNSASGSDTITATTSSAQQFNSMSCAAFKNVRLTNAMDSGAINAQNVNHTGANPALGSAQTPTNGNELVIGLVQTSSATTPTAGSGYTVVGNMPIDTEVPEYQIQAVATSTTVPYTEATSDTWTEMTTAFIPAGGPAGVTPFTGHFNALAGSTTGTQMTGALLNASNVGTLNAGAWGTNAGYSYITYNTSGALNCGGTSPIYINGISQSTTGGSVGFQYLTGTSNSGFQFQFGGSLAAASYPQVTISFCIETDIPSSDVHSYSMNVIENGASYCGAQLDPNGTNLQIRLEGSGSTSGNITISANTIYRVQIQYLAAGSACNMAVYTSGGSQVGSTLTATNGGTNANSVELGDFGAESQASGDHVWFNNLQISYTAVFPLP
jgi:hypothetical protein